MYFHDKLRNFNKVLTFNFIGRVLKLTHTHCGLFEFLPKFINIKLSIQSKAEHCMFLILIFLPCTESRNEQLKPPKNKFGGEIFWYQIFGFKLFLQLTNNNKHISCCFDCEVVKLNKIICVSIYLIENSSEKVHQNKWNHFSTTATKKQRAK